MSDQQWKEGDEIRHTGRPEWGTGTVQRAEAAVVEGKSCQRLTVRFSREGLKTLSTAFASLAPAGGEPVSAGGGGWLDQVERRDPKEALVEIPESARDPFRSPLARLEATLGLYRFTGEGGSLLDWAAAQTGMTDPLEIFSRHELEEHYRRFRQALDDHLRRAAFEASKSDRAGTRKLLNAAPPAAHGVIRRLNVA